MPCLATRIFVLVVALLPWIATGYRYDPLYVEYNLNQNESATHPLDYWGQREGHEYHPSPLNWRFPFYTIFLDRFVNGDPNNDNINGTLFEHALDSNQMRHGGDLVGLFDTLDYLQGMGIRALYIAGSPFLNAAWQYDQYSPLDLSILDPHFGSLDQWRGVIDEIHARGMYVVLDNTFATMGDLIGFEGYLNETAPFTLDEHRVQWKSARRYWDFDISNDYNSTCTYPTFWNETGFPIDASFRDQMQGCYNSDFDQYGDTEAFGVYPDFRRQLTKFASVQDRLREWHPPVRAKLENFYCMMIAQLDIDGYRFDKAMQSTVDALGEMTGAMRRCARRFGKTNFFLTGEITGGNQQGSIFIGRGRQPDQIPANLTAALQLNATNADTYSIRPVETSALDSSCFHYTVYRTLTRFLGLDGNLAAGYDAPLNWVDQWNNFLLTNDLFNPSLDTFDPRHMYGVTNQDVFRWPGITDGIHRQILGHFITVLLLPGIPIGLWGEEQAFYVLDSTADNYIFGRQPMSSASAWQQHGCYHLDSSQYYHMPWNSTRQGCNDHSVGYDHRDPSAPVRNILRHFYDLRTSFTTLNDGFFLRQLSNQTEQITYPGSSGVSTETGIWSVVRTGFPDVQNVTEMPPIWMLYSNLNRSSTYHFDCSDNTTDLNTTALLAPFAANTTLKNLLFPYEEILLENSNSTSAFDGANGTMGCLSRLPMDAYGFKLFVPTDEWVAPRPMITGFTPGHDSRLVSTVGPHEVESIQVELQFSREMNCSDITDSVVLTSTTDLQTAAFVNLSSVACRVLEEPLSPSHMVGNILSAFAWSAEVVNVANGVHRLTVQNASSVDGNSSTGSTDHFLFRVGQPNNPLVFPETGNYSTTLLNEDVHGTLLLNHSAAGADLYRYSTNFGSSFSAWRPYVGGMHAIDVLPWAGTDLQAWESTHIRVEYFSRLAGSSDAVQEGDLNVARQRRFPHMFFNGPFNSYGYDAGISNQLMLVENHTWSYNWMTEWTGPSGDTAQINIWGMNPDGKPDASFVYGDVDGDSILDRLPPSALAPAVLNVTRQPPLPHLSWQITINDGTMRYTIEPTGSMWLQLALYVALAVVPIFTALVSVWLYLTSFYQVKFNKIGLSRKVGLLFGAVERCARGLLGPQRYEMVSTRLITFGKWTAIVLFRDQDSLAGSRSKFLMQNNTYRRTVLIATMEYDIEDWNVKIKIGGLGVMAQLMGKSLTHQRLIWVVPRVSGVEYPDVVDPETEVGEPMVVTIFDESFEVAIRYHTLQNITYVLLDAPIFRKQTKSDPYPARMDDLESAVYYSAWNQCIAQALERFDIDLYHINDYHGTLAPLYLLGRDRTIPVSLSLHNAEFQGLWPMRTRPEVYEVCSAFNLSHKVVAEYVQYGEVFNMLHAGASYLRIHQDGFGAVGVSKKYGKRSYARYPIFWGLKEVEALQNPDPSDIQDWDGFPTFGDAKVEVDEELESKRLDDRTRAQEWAGLKQDRGAELFVFVGRWSMQKGVDLIADVFPAILKSNSKVQLITIGPVIDLYGKFAALKLGQIMKKYPDRVCSKPVFTALPPYIFSGAEFALIPSRDEPFGLVAVEFGRKGALGVGSRVGGLGQMPGWWYSVESITTAHLLGQLQSSIKAALACPKHTRAEMRARSAKQRFPVAQWVEELDILQRKSIQMHDRVATKKLLLAGHLPASSRQSSTTNLLADKTRGRPSSIISRRSHADNVPTPDVSRGPSPVGSPVQSRPASSLSFRPHSRRISIGEAERPPMPKTRWSSDFHVPTYTPTTTSEADTLVVNNRTAAFQMLHSGTASSSNDNLVAVRGPGNTEGTFPVPRTADDRQPPGQLESNGNTGVTALPPLSHEESMIPVSGTKPETLLSLETVVGSRENLHLQQVDQFFTDQGGSFYRAFEQKLQGLDSRNSRSSLCIEENLVRAEKKWANAYRVAKLRKSTHLPSVSVTELSSTGSDLASSTQHATSHGPASSTEDETATSSNDTEHASARRRDDEMEEFPLGLNYRRPHFLQRLLQRRAPHMTWPLYAFLLALGQILSANSYQITLLTGEIGQSSTRLYTVASIYLGFTIVWWCAYRTFGSLVPLSVPFLLYGGAFIAIGVAQYAPTSVGRTWVQNAGIGLYSAASASGFLFFSLNFGDEGGVHTQTWVFRAGVIQGVQQVYITALWFWGKVLSSSASGAAQSNGGYAQQFSNSWKITAITGSIAAALWLIGLLLYFGLPSFYRQKPGKMPSFYRSLTRRKIALWLLVTAIIQNFFFSTQNGRNWSFLFSSQHAETWQVLVLVVVFFIGVWTALLTLLGHLSRTHTWIVPIFGIGLGAPRWAQMWWGTSNIGLWLPWAPWGFVGSALFSRALWLWLGVLDTIQGVGIGFILLGTLTRVHVAAVVAATQVVGSLATILARAVGPNRIGPASTFPDISAGLGQLWQPWFWIGLVSNLIVCAGFFQFYRKEQLTKP